ncbi:MAG TPA: oxygen-independent coproporphyrinogen III oxidase [Clostridiaceae bacterium]|nr:oxygen-independent coproporphyrinogen III oxidase [Clostridiaceae bacterium]
MQTQKNDNTLGLYIHIPFCKSKCYYCDFFSFAGREDIIYPYFQALKNEIESYKGILGNYKIGTVYIGGGTPSVVDANCIRELINNCRKHFNIEPGAEISIEANPGTLSFDKLATYLDTGINRLSIGMQAWQDRLLESIGRIHRSGEFIENFELARKAGFTNINVDLIFGLPGQTFDDWTETVDNVAELKPSHISCYSLKIEEGTVFGDMLGEGRLKPVEDELDRQMYHFAIDRLAGHGFRHYEISNFSKPGFECKHNLVYWEGRQYIGLGAGAHSYFNGKRYNNTYDLNNYINCAAKNQFHRENIEEIDINGQISEYIILGLRLIRGVDVDKFKMKFETDVFDLFGKQIDRLISRGLIEFNERTLRLTKLGLDLANQVFIEFL